MNGPDSNLPLILASASPRRSEILTSLGILHSVVPAQIPEIRQEGEAPEAYVERLAREKAETVQALHPEGWVLAGDTTVALGSEVLEKPSDRADAVRMLLRLAGRSHQVATGLALAGPGGVVRSGVQVTSVHFRPFTAAEAEGYAATGEPMDKAGAYGIQGLGGTLVEGIEGDFSTVVGLSIPLLVRLLGEVGQDYRFPRAHSPESSTEAPGLQLSHYTHLLLREVAAVRREVLAYPTDASLWATLPGWPNTGGTLAFHLAGNLRHHVGAVLGNTGYLRDRDAEFSRQGLTRTELAAELADAELALQTTLSTLPPSRLSEPWPVELAGQHPPVGAMLLHILSHTAYHLGQIDFHRRGVTGKGEGVDAIALGDLPSPG